MAVEEKKLEDLLGRIITDLGAAEGVALHRIGDDRGIWKAMAGAGPLTTAQVAERSGCAERYVREWLKAEAIAGYVQYDARDETFSITDEVAFAFADSDSPVYMGGAWQVTSALYEGLAKVTDAFRTGEGVAWANHGHDLFEGVERFFRPGYNANLLSSWLPSLDGVVEKLERGATVADVGCGHGASTVIMAQAFPNSTFVGFDYHDASIATARKAAAEAGVADRVSFEVAPAQAYPGRGYDLVCFFDCLHDMGDPDGAARHVHSTLAGDGTWLLVEPAAFDTLTESMNPVSRVYYASSTLLCLPASLADEGHKGLGNQVPEGELRQLVQDAGFSTLRRATETAFNRIFEVKP
jgi:SAM-dependent methyltransferase